MSKPERMGVDEFNRRQRAGEFARTGIGRRVTAKYGDGVAVLSAIGEGREVQAPKNPCAGATRPEVAGSIPAASTKRSRKPPAGDPPGPGERLTNPGAPVVPPEEYDRALLDWAIDSAADRIMNEEARADILALKAKVRERCDDGSAS